MGKVKDMVGVSALTLVLAAVIGAFLGLGTFTFTYGEGGSYYSSDPAVCTNCHIMQPHFDAWLKSSHHDVATCADCHLPHRMPDKLVVKADNGFFHSWAFTFDNFHEPIRIKDRNLDLLNRNCLHCHSDIAGQLLRTETHSEDVSCVRCHSQVGHAAWR